MLIVCIIFEGESGFDRVVKTVLDIVEAQLSQPQQAKLVSEATLIIFSNTENPHFNCSH